MLGSTGTSLAGLALWKWDVRADTWRTTIKKSPIFSSWINRCLGVPDDGPVVWQHSSRR